MICLRRKILSVFMMLMVLFGAVTPVYASQVVPALAFVLNGFVDQSPQKSSGEFRDVMQASKVMPCHKLEKTSREALCFKHCLSSLNQPCLLSASNQLDGLADASTKLSFDIAPFLVPDHRVLQRLSGADPPLDEMLNKREKRLSIILLTSSRFRF